MSDAWFYELSGQRIGPVGGADLCRLLDTGVLARGSLVWNATFGQAWKTLGETELAAERLETMPPALPSVKLNDTYAWLLAFVPLVGLLLEQGLPPQNSDRSAVVLLFYFVVNTTLAALDLRVIQRAGHLAPVKFWIFIIPVWLWKRATTVNGLRVYFWVWVGLVIFATLAGN